MNPSRFQFPTDPARQFVERRGGWILAVCLILILFAWLRAKTVPVVHSEPAPERTAVRVALALPESNPLPGPQPPVELSDQDRPPEPVIQEPPQDQQQKPPEAPKQEQPRQPEPPEQSEPPEPKEQPPQTPDETLAAMASDVAIAQNVQSLDQRLDKVQAQAREQAAQGSSEVAQRIRMARAKVIANKTLFSSRGSRQGVIRELDTSDVSDDVAQQVLARYGCKIMLTHVETASPGGLEYLDSANTAQGFFANRAGKGGNRVFSYPMSAVARMSQLEEDAIVRKGWDPATTRVTRVVFGVLPTTKGWDLAVKEIEGVPVPGTEEKTASRPEQGE